MVLRGLVVGTLLLAQSAHADQWKVTVDRLSVEPRKADGRAWDGDNSGPDVFGEFSVGQLVNGLCVAQTKGKLAKRNDTLAFNPSLSLVVDAPSVSSLCAVAKVIDADVLENDIVGTGEVRLQEGSLLYRVGQASLAISVESTLVAAPEPVQGPPPRTSIYKVSVVSAQIRAKRSDGAEWDPREDKAADDANLFGALIGVGLHVMSGGASLVLGAGALLSAAQRRETESHAARTNSAPDPRVRIRWGTTSFITTVARNTLQPSWDFTFLIPAEIAETKPLRIDVLDEDGTSEETIGATSFSGAEVVGSTVFKRSFGQVEEIVLEVEKTSEQSAALESVLRLETSKGWADTGIDVLAGQTIHISTVGQHCIAGTCTTADGLSRVVATASKRDVGAVTDLREGQLAAAVGDDVFPVGTSGMFVARSSGRVVLGVASKSSSGTLTSKLRVFYPLTP